MYFRLPQKGDERRQHWINNIKNHQRFTAIHDSTIGYTVCSEHFRPEELARSKGRTVARGPPTIFPPSVEVHEENDDSGLECSVESQSSNENLPQW